MTCRVPEPCGQSACDALAEIGHLLPKGAIWRLDEGRNFTRYWSAVAQAKSDLMAAICQEWAEANPCTSSRTLARWADLYRFPVDCVELTTDKLCEWIAFIASCGAGTEGFFMGLLDFVEFDTTGLTIEFRDSGRLFDGCCQNEVVISGDFALFTEIPCDCTWSVFEAIRYPCGKLVIPEIECLRDYLPANLDLKYVADCDPNLIRQLRAAA